MPTKHQVEADRIDCELSSLQDAAYREGFEGVHFALTKARSEVRKEMTNAQRKETRY